MIDTTVHTFARGPLSASEARTAPAGRQGSAPAGKRAPSPRRPTARSWSERRAAGVSPSATSSTGTAERQAGRAARTTTTRHPAPNSYRAGVI